MAVQRINCNKRITYHVGLMSDASLIPAEDIQKGAFLFCGGAIPRNPEKNWEIPLDFEEQCHVTFKNMKGVLEAAGTSVDNLVRVIVYLTDMRNWETMNKVYVQYIKSAPARACIGIDALNNKYQIEVIADAFVPAKK
ncbi:MAG: RidA family protein [Candidatus Brocadiales bacterium]